MSTRRGPLAEALQDACDALDAAANRLDWYDALDPATDAADAAYQRALAALNLAPEGPAGYPKPPPTGASDTARPSTTAHTFTASAEAASGDKS